MHVVKEVLNLQSVTKLPKGYVIHHKDGNHDNNAPENLILLDKSTHILIHRLFGNVLINALHTGRISKEDFFELCNENQKEFYMNIINVNITNQILTNDFKKTINNNKYVYYDESKIKKG